MTYLMPGAGGPKAGLTDEQRNAEGDGRIPTFKECWSNNKNQKQSKMNESNLKKLIIFLAAIFLFQLAFCERYAGIEVGGKGIKVAVIDVLDVNEGKFSIFKDWTRNTAVTKNISVDKKLAKQDITETSMAVNEIYQQLKSDFGVPDSKLFIVGSSGVAIAVNKEDLETAVEALTHHNMEFITSEQEGKLVTKGAVPVNRYDNSLVWDIGGGNSKGGYVLKDGGYYYFYPMAFDYGGVTLTEKITKLYNPKDFAEFARGLNEFVTDTLRPQVVKRMFDNKSGARRKQNFYAIGGGSWAFAATMFPTNKDNYMTFKYSDVVDYRNHILVDYDSWIEQQSALNPDGVNRVLDTYSREALLTTATILQCTLDEMNNKENVNCNFVRKGYVAWIIAYVVDSVRKG